MVVIVDEKVDGTEGQPAMVKCLTNDDKFVMLQSFKSYHWNMLGKLKRGQVMYVCIYILMYSF